MDIITKNFSDPDLNPAQYNPRDNLQPGEPEFEDIKESIQRFGMVQPYVWNRRTHNLVSGHQRMTVERHLGKTEGPFFVVDLEENEEMVLNVALNNIKGRWNRPKLEEVLMTLKRAEFNLERLGFKRAELRNLLRRKTIETQRDPDFVPRRPLRPRTKPGDVIELQADKSEVQHRVICGDATDPRTTRTLMGSVKARLLLTDPPYGVAYVPRKNASANRKAPTKRIQNDELTGNHLTGFLTAIFRNAFEHARPKAAMICFYASRHHIEFEQAIKAAGWTPLQQLIWVKESLVLGWRGFHWQHEPIFYAGRDSLTTEWFGDRTATTVIDDEPPLEQYSRDQLADLVQLYRDQATIWRIARDHGTTPLHTTQKPVEAGRRPMRLLTMPGDTVLETCGGSGFVAMAGELEQRYTCTVELDPANVDVIVERFRGTFVDVTITRNGKQENES